MTSVPTNREHFDDETKDYTSILTAIGHTIRIVGMSPIELEVIDPTGRRVSKSLNEIPGASYEEFDADGDGHPNDIVTIPFPAAGDYQIRVLPEPGALLTDTYSLEVTAGDKTTTLAKDVQIQSIPSVPYVTQAIVPFAVFDPERAIAGRIGRNKTRVELRGEFALGPESDGLTLPTDVVAITLGDFSAAIPSGSFLADTDDDDRGRDREFQFFGNGGSIERVVIKRERRNKWEFRIRASGEEIAALDFGQPIPFALRIGDDRGETEVHFDTKRRAADRD